MHSPANASAPCAASRTRRGCRRRWSSSSRRHSRRTAMRLARRRSSTTGSFHRRKGAPTCGPSTHRCASRPPASPRSRPAAAPRCRCWTVSRPRSRASRSRPAGSPTPCSPCRWRGRSRVSNGTAIGGTRRAPATSGWSRRRAARRGRSRPRSPTTRAWAWTGPAHRGSGAGWKTRSTARRARSTWAARAIRDRWSTRARCCSTSWTATTSRSRRSGACSSIRIATCPMRGRAASRGLMTSACRQARMRGATVWLAAWIVLLMLATPAGAGVRRIWAVNDGEKVERDAHDHPAAARNSAWDGRVVRLSGARNEVIAFQLIVEADASGLERLSVRLPGLASGSSQITYKPPAADPTDYVDRPIGVYAVHYMHVETPSKASWVYEPGSAAAPPDPTGWKPVQLVPEHARGGRGGLPIAVRPDENQAIWIEIYVDGKHPAGVYRGTIDVLADGTRQDVPVELEVFDFTLPDENSMHAMLFYTSDQVERYQGRNLDAAYDRLAHRHRVELVHEYDEQAVTRAIDRFTGRDFTRERGYEGPGVGAGNVIMPRSFYGAGTEFEDRATAWARSDAWMTFLKKSFPRAITFLYMPDEPRA